MEDRPRKERIWQKQINHGNELEAFRAEQFMKLTEGDGRIKTGKELVSIVLSHCVYEENGYLTFYFLDGSHVKIKP